jgi:S-phase kinase-associated protein 1
VLREPVANASQWLSCLLIWAASAHRFLTHTHSIHTHTHTHTHTTQTLFSSALSLSLSLSLSLALSLSLSLSLSQLVVPSMSSLDDDSDEVIKLRSKDGREFSISKRACMLSGLILTTLEDKNVQEVALFHIDGTEVEFIVQYLTYHQDVVPRVIEKPLPSNNMADLVDQFDCDFVETKPQETIFKLLLAANYMDIKPLLLLLCAKIASLMKGKSPEQIRGQFDIRSNYTPEEEEEVRREHKDLIE